MMGLIFILVPGAITYLTAMWCGRNVEKKPTSALVEYIACAGLDMGAFWTLENCLGGAVAAVTAETLYQDFSLADFWKSIILALVMGVLIAFLKEINAEVRVVKVKEGIFSRMPLMAKRVSKWVVAVLCIVLAGAIMFESQISLYVDARKSTARKEFVTAMLDGIREQVNDLNEDGVAPKDFGNLTIEGNITVRKVSTDQYWSSATTGVKEAVYMVDGNGTVVYFSYRDKAGASTWSGPSEDSEFISNHGGWYDGNGAGWSQKAFIVN